MFLFSFLDNEVPAFFLLIDWRAIHGNEPFVVFPIAADPLLPQGGSTTQKKNRKILKTRGFFFEEITNRKGIRAGKQKRARKRVGGKKTRKQEHEKKKEPAQEKRGIFFYVSRFGPITTC